MHTFTLALPAHTRLACTACKICSAYSTDHHNCPSVNSRVKACSSTTCHMLCATLKCSPCCLSVCQFGCSACLSAAALRLCDQHNASINPHQHTLVPTTHNDAQAYSTGDLKVTNNCNNSRMPALLLITPALADTAAQNRAAAASNVQMTNATYATQLVAFLRCKSGAVAQNTQSRTRREAACVNVHDAPHTYPTCRMLQRCILPTTIRCVPLVSCRQDWSIMPCAAHPAAASAYQTYAPCQHQGLAAAVAVAWLVWLKVLAVAAAGV